LEITAETGHFSAREVPSSAFLFQFVSSTSSTKLWLMTNQFGGDQRDDRLLLFVQFVCNFGAGLGACQLRTFFPVNVGAEVN